jgi:hypothetical protein
MLRREGARDIAGQGEPAGDAEAGAHEIAPAADEQCLTVLIHEIPSSLNDCDEPGKNDAVCEIYRITIYART